MSTNIDTHHERLLMIYNYWSKICPSFVFTKLNVFSSWINS